MHNWICVLAFFISSVPLFSSGYLNVDSDVREQCFNSCKLQNRTDVAHYDDTYGSNIQCEEGCRLWKAALNSSCQGVCNGEASSPNNLFCIIGCTYAVLRYSTKLTQHLGPPPPPALVADSLTATSLRLEWNFPEAKVSGLRYFLQWRYEEHAGAWQYCRNQSWGPQDTVFVDNLQPYTKYRFRVALILSNLTDPIVSPPSVVISTRPAGVPASAPIIVRAVPVDSTRISVSWEPGPFPHGPLLSYELTITDNQPQHRYSALKDLSSETNFYILKNLTPNHNYSISIGMINSVGRGPPANVTVSTPPEPSAKNSEKPVLILGAHHAVIEQGTDMLDEPVILYSTNEFITGLAIHVSKRLLFVSDSTRYVHRMPLYKYTNHTKNTVILSPRQINFIPLDLSIDWLNNELYILGEVTHQIKAWQIARCNLDGRGLTVAVAGLRSKPHHIEVDPYNGYLFWVTKVGLYKLDLADISNGIKHEVQPELILAENNLGSFTVDHTNFRLFVSNQNKNTVYSVSFDGKEIMNMRQKITKSRLQKVISLASANKIFYWTDGNEVLYEEYHASSESQYFHNSYPSQLSRSYIKVLVNLTSSQPVPVPVNPPTSVQAIFGTKKARTMWNTPHLLGGQGKGAWQNWSYRVFIKDLTTHNTRLISNISSTHYTVLDLNENTEYIIKAAASTSYGNGPWSTEFIGRSLKLNSNGKNAIILWSGVEGLLKSDASGEKVEIVVPQSNMSNYYFNDIAWYKDQLFMVTNSSQVYWYNITSRQDGILMDIDSVGSIAIDWIGKKLYWSNPKQQLIIRGNLNGTQHERLPIVKVVKELNIDSVKGYLYWSTVNEVECAYLNGAENGRIVYHESHIFSGEQVMGLTLDMDHSMVYWIVRGSDGSNLFKAPMAGYSSNVGSKAKAEKVSSLQKPSILGPLCYFNNRLIWLQDDKSAVISDLDAKYAASISGKNLHGLNMMFVIDSSLHITPNASKHSTISGISVLPEIIEKTSVKVVGTWESFNITWKPVQNVNYGTVFYEIKIDTLFRNDSLIVTTFPSTRYLKSVVPYTDLKITLRAFTYWGSSPHIRVRLHSPPSTPSAPRNPRTYVIHQHHYKNSDQINITYRWSTPASTNGVLEGYKVFWWCFVDKKNINDSVIVDASDKEYVVGNLQQNTTYYFQVQAFTEIGDGIKSAIVQVNSSNESPIPTLLLSSSDSIDIKDIDTNQTHSLIHGINTPIELAYLIKERKIFWINDMQELMLLNLAGMNRSKIYEFNGKSVVSLTVNWLERSLYYIQQDEHDGSLLYKLDLNHMERGTMKNKEIFRAPYVISRIEISPFARKLYWVESDNNKKYKLMQANTDGSNITKFFSEQYRQKRSDLPCNCPLYPSIEKSFSIDHSGNQNIPSLIFIDSTTKNIISSDKHGCHCKTLVNNTSVKNSLPILNLKSDFNMVYFTNKTRGLVYSMKTTSNSLKVDQITSKDLLIYGPHMQPYPPNRCLRPIINQNLLVSLHNKTSKSLVLKMPDYDVNPKCGNISIATVEYRVFYMPYNDVNDINCDESCTQEVTFAKTMEIKNLRPYSSYVFSLALSNYYSGFNQNKIYIGPGVVFKTAAGAPSPPRNVEVIVLNPTLVQVKWLPPIELNGDFVYYEIHWRTEGFITGIRQKGEQPIIENELHDTKMYGTNVHKLTPNESYSIWVRAYSQTNETSSDSDIVKITTFPEPDNILLVSNLAFKLNIQWDISPYVEKYTIQYALLTSYEWSDLKYSDTNGTTLRISIDDLKPKTQYKFRLYLKYPKYKDAYIWPKDARFSFETLGDRPSPPGTPKIQHVKDNIYQVWWEASKDNGAAIDMYMLEAFKSPSYRSRRSTTNRTAWHNLSPSLDDLEWESIYNGTDTFWKITDLSEQFRYSFRVSSLNAYGWSNLSEQSIQFDPSAAAQIVEKQNFKYLVYAIAIPCVVIVAACIAGIICRLCCITNKKKQHILDTPKGPDVELATLRELPRRGNFIHNTNVLYISTQVTPEELTALPHIKRDRITLMKFLGSGAFGEVFEGIAKGLGPNGKEAKVAVKTLRKGASDQEKTEFLQEAQLMSHFKHEHILQLLGVCLDNDPHFIIMELMEGGDLLTYVRSSRKTGSDLSPLNLLDLLKMCVDVATGCRYLEEMHFVHRDLACRNCLVSSTNPETRIVKIGDFGLARDIYKNDYYRKEGEGLLPVRWMAPESLVDGVFTCQSDVWAFGVLLWEIMTLGQQPYPARNNLEVLHYVRRGGRLGKPTDCPEDLYILMLSCWSYEPERRPTFKFCLDALLRLHIQAVNSPMTGAHVGQYISTVPQPLLDGISNQAYFQDENHNNNSGASWKSGSEDDCSRERLPFIPRQMEIPHYLELLHDTTENDGYEIPRTTLDKYQGVSTEPPEDECDMYRKNTEEEPSNIEDLLNVGYTNMNPEQNCLNKTNDKAS